MGTTGVGTVHASVKVGSDAASSDIEPVGVEKGKGHLINSPDKVTICKCLIEDKK